MRNPRFSFLFFILWIFFGFQHDIKAKLIFNGTFDLWSHGREFNLIHYFHGFIWSWNSFLSCLIMGYHNGWSHWFFLFDHDIWFRIRFLRFVYVFIFLVAICCLFIIIGDWDDSLQSISTSSGMPFSIWVLDSGASHHVPRFFILLLHYLLCLLLSLCLLDVDPNSIYLCLLDMNPKFVCLYLLDMNPNFVYIHLLDMNPNYVCFYFFYGFVSSSVSFPSFLFLW